MNYTIFRLATVFAWALCSAQLSVAQESFDESKDVDDAVIQQMKQQGIVGVAVGITDFFIRFVEVIEVVFDIVFVFEFLLKVVVEVVVKIFVVEIVRVIESVIRMRRI